MLFADRTVPQQSHAGGAIPELFFDENLVGALTSRADPPWNVRWLAPLSALAATAVRLCPATTKRRSFNGGTITQVTVDVSADRRKMESDLALAFSRD